MNKIEALKYLYAKVKILAAASEALKGNQVFTDPDMRIMLQRISGETKSWEIMLSNKLKEGS